MENLSEIEAQKSLYKKIAKDFLFGGVRVRDLEKDTIYFYNVFNPKNAFYPEDARLLLDFCRAILKSYNCFKKRLLYDLKRNTDKFSKLMKIKDIDRVLKS